MTGTLHLIAGRAALAARGARAALLAWQLRRLALLERKGAATATPTVR